MFITPMNTNVDIYPLVAFPFGLDHTTSNETVSFKYASIHTRERRENKERERGERKERENEERERREKRRERTRRENEEDKCTHVGYGGGGTERGVRAKDS